MDRDDVDMLLDDLWRPTRLDFSILALFFGVCPSHLKLVLPSKVKDMKIYLVDQYTYVWSW
jgi:hypothetical protein